MFRCTITLNLVNATAIESRGRQSVIQTVSAAPGPAGSGSEPTAGSDAAAPGATATGGAATGLVSEPAYGADGPSHINMLSGLGIEDRLKESFCQQVGEVPESKGGLTVVQHALIQ